MTFAFFSWQTAAACAAYFSAGLIDSICGGGGLITVPVLMAMGTPVHYITGTNQCSVIAGTVAAIYKYQRSGSIQMKSALIAALTAILGGILGAKLNMFLPEKFLEIVMIVLMPLVALLVFLKKDFGESDRSDALSPMQVVCFSCVIGLLGGAYQGFYGAGSGMLFLLAFALLMKLDFVRASGTAKLAMFFAAVSSSATYAHSGLVIWQIVIAATAFNILGNYIGSTLAIKNGAKVIRPFLFVMIAVLFVTLILR